MKLVRALPALAAAAALTACGSHAASPSAAAAPATSASCHSQYAAWKTGAAKPAAKRLKAALAAVQSAGASDDLVLLASGLKRAGRAAHAMQSYPMPACADPAGYWQKVLADIRASGDNAGTASGLVGLIAAEVPLKKIPPLERKLAAELKNTGAR